MSIMVSAEGVPERTDAKMQTMKAFAILIIDFFIGYFLSGLYRGLYGFKSLV